jgi:hypothetical protein
MDKKERQGWLEGKIIAGRIRVNRLVFMHKISLIQSGIDKIEEKFIMEL